MVLEGIRERINRRIDSIRRERAAEQATQKIIREKVAAIDRAERVKAAERVARARIEARTDAQIKAIRKPDPQRGQRIANQISSGLFGSPSGSINPITGRSMTPAPIQQIRKSKKGKKNRKTQRFIQPQQIQPRRFDVIGGGY